MLTSGEKYVAFWGPRIGTVPARMRWSAVHKLTVGWYLQATWTALAIIAGQTGNQELVIVIVPLVLAQGCLIVWGFIGMHRAHKMAGDLLNLRLGFRHVSPPPRSKARYEAWCRKHAQVPYMADGYSARPETGVHLH